MFYTNSTWLVSYELYTIKKFKVSVPGKQSSRGDYEMGFMCVCGYVCG